VGPWTRICCAVDGTEPSRAALEHAIDLARRHPGALLHVLHVRPAVPSGGAPFAPPPRRPPEEPDDERGRMTGWTAAAREALPGRVEAVERSGDAAAEIVAYAEEWAADVLVLGTHARSGFQRLVLGSVAEEVLREARCPVLVVPASVERPGAGYRSGAGPDALGV
jgi:nucleotide-binding universal stress UspA family protein